MTIANARRDLLPFHPLANTFPLMNGAGPPVDFYLGPKGLTKKGKARNWLRSLLRPAERDKAAAS